MNIWRPSNKFIEVECPGCNFSARLNAGYAPRAARFGSHFWVKKDEKGQVKRCLYKVSEDMKVMSFPFQTPEMLTFGSSKRGGRSDVRSHCRLGPRAQRTK